MQLPRVRIKRQLYFNDFSLQGSTAESATKNLYYGRNSPITGSIWLWVFSRNQQRTAFFYSNDY